MTGVGQKSPAGELIGASSLRGSGHGSPIRARSDTQMSFGSSRFDAMSRLKPSAVSIGHPSFTFGLLTPFSPSATILALPQLGANGQPCSLKTQPCAAAGLAPIAHTVSRAAPPEIVLRHIVFSPRCLVGTGIEPQGGRKDMAKRWGVRGK